MKRFDRQNLNIPIQDYIEAGIAQIGEKVRRIKRTFNPCDNNGSCYYNKTFSINTYNWISIDMPTENFSYNFKYKFFYVSWYKCLGKSSCQSNNLNKEEWDLILNECLESIK